MGLACVAAVTASFLAAVVGPTAAQALPTLSAPTVTSSTCSPTKSGYLCTSPAVTLSGSGADPGATVIVASTNGTWLDQATSDSNGHWSVPVVLLANQNPYSLDAFEVNTTAEGAPSSAVSVTVTSNQLITDGSFEQPSLGSTSWQNFGASITGWTATNSCGVELQSKSTVGVTPYDGLQYDELASNCVSGIKQTVATVPGFQYTLSFAYRARPNTPSSYNTMAVKWGGQTVAPSLQGGSSWTVATYTLTASSTSMVLEFDDTATTQNSTGDFVDGVSVMPTAALAPPNTDWTTASTVSTSGTSGTASQALTYTGEGLWYKFAVQPGQQVSVQLSNLGGNYQILLFSDLAQAEAALGSGTPNLPVIQAEAAGNNDSAAQFSPFHGAPFHGVPFHGAPFHGAPVYGASSSYSPFHGAAVQDQAILSDSILAQSAQPGTSNQSVQADTWNDTGNFYVEVYSTDGTFSQSPYTLTVSIAGGPCQGVTLQNFSSDVSTPTPGGALPGPVNASGQPYSTVIVDNSSAMPQVGPSYTGTDGIYSSLTALAALPSTNGVVLDAAQSKGVQELITQANSNPGCPYAANLEAQGIQTLINNYRAYSSGGTALNNLKYVVIVGDDGVIPFFRYADAETVGPENTYQVPLSSTSSLEAALQNNLYLTDAQYGAASDLNIDGTLLPIQSAAVGRLVRTPADIASAIQSYLQQQVITPTSTLTTGYDFMAPPATQVGQYFTNGVQGSAAGPNYNDQLIDPQTGGNPWTATDLLSSLTSRPHQLAFIGGHFDASNALAADDSTYISTQQFASAIGNNLKGSVVLGAGCHAGYNVDPADATPVTNPLAWPQAFTEAGATLIAGSGYQYGDTNYVADSDQVYVDMAQQLYQTGGQAVPVGTALLDAESQYLASLDQLNGLEEKALLEVTLYGLPMLGVQEPHASSTTVPTPSTTGVVSTANNLVGSNTPGQVLGTQEFDLPVGVPALSAVTPPGTTLSYDQGPQGEVADPGSPIVPVMTEDVNVPNYTLTGVGFFGGSYTDTSGAPPLTGDPVTDTSQPPTPFSSPTYTPQGLTNPNYFAALDTGSGTQLGITPEQYITDPSNAANAIKRQFSNLDLHLFYSNNTSSYGGNVPALAAAPNIAAVTSTESGNQVSVSATVSGDPAAGIQEVWVTYTDPPSGNGAGKWQSVDLSQSTIDPSQWTGTFTDPSPGNAVFMVQASNGIGDVSLNNNQGSFFAAAPGGSQAAPATLSLGGVSSAVFGSTATVSATLKSTSGTTLAGRQVSFAIGSNSAIGVTSSTGVATAQVPLTGLPAGSDTLTASFAGDATDSPASATSAFTVSQAPTTLTLSLPASGQIISGKPNAISASLVSAAGGVAQKTVYFVVSDSHGNAIGGSTGTTNQSGVAQAGVITLPSNYAGSTETVTAYFASPTIPFPGGTIYNAPDPDYLASTSAPAAAAILGAIDVSVSGTEAYGSTPTFSYTSNAPTGVTVSGSLSCATEGGGTGVLGLPPGTYTLDGGTCAGLSTSSPGYTVYDYVGSANGFVVSPANQTVAFTSSAPTSALVGGATYSPTASSTSGLAVSITVDSSTSTVCSITSGVVSFQNPGTCVLDANQAGNNNYNAATQMQQSFTAQALLPVTVSGTETYGASPTFTYTSSPPAGVTLSGPLACSTEGGGTPLAGLAPGTYTLDGVNCTGLSSSSPLYIVSYVGLSNGYLVSPANQTVSFTSSAPTNALIAGATYTPTASSTSGLDVAVMVDSSASSVCSIDPSGVVSFQNPGTCLLDANQAGNNNYNPATQVQQSFAVQAMVTVSVSGHQGYGSSTPTFAISAISGALSSVVVGTPSCTTVGGAPINSSLAAGSYTIDGTSCTGLSLNDPNNFYVLSVIGSPGGFAVSPANQTVAFTSSAPTNALVGGAAYTPLASSTSGLGVVVTVDSSASSVCSVDMSGVVSFQSPGTCVLDANQAGNNNYHAATQVQQSFTVEALLPVTVSGTQMYGGSPTFTYTSSPPAGVSLSGPLACATEGGGTPLAGLSPGNYTLDAASCTGLSSSSPLYIVNYVSALKGFVVSPATQTVNFTSSAPTNAMAGSATYTPTASSTSGLAVSITVDSSASSVCSITSGVVSFQKPGTCVLDANQAGNTNYHPAPQVQQSFSVSTLAFVLGTPPTTAYSGLTYAYVFAANSNSTITYSLGAGSASFLSIDPSTGLVTGAPPAKIKTFTYSVVARSNAGSVTAGPFTVTVSSTQGSGAGLSVLLSCPASASVGSPVSCTVTATNNGPNAAQNVIVWVSVPAGLGNVSLSSGGNLYSQSGWWSVTSLAPKASASFTLNATAVSNTTVSMTAIVLSTTNPDSKFADNVASVNMAL